MLLNMGGNHAGVRFRQVPKSLFAKGEQGVWYDPSDLTTMFQDTTGTQQITAPGQTVALMLDKSRGLTLGPELVSNGDFSAGTTGWTTSGGGGTEWSIGAGVAAYSGTLNANLSTSASIAIAGRWYEVRFDVVSGSGITLSPYIVAQVDPLAFATFTGIGVGSYRCLLRAPSAGALTLRRQAGSSFTIDNVSVRELPGNHAAQPTPASRPTYRVDAGGLGYLEFDGTDDFLSTAAINFTATDKMTVFAGVRRLQDTATAIVAELSATIASNAGSFYVTAPESASIRFSSASRGSAATTTALRAEWLTGTAPDTAVLAATHDIAGDLSTIRRNGMAGGTATGDKGAGNFGNYPLFIGRRGGTSLPFNGHLYGLIVRGAATNAADVTSTETWMNRKTGAY